MEDFMEKNKFRFLSHLFTSNGVSENTFFLLTSEEINKILHDYPGTIDFISKLNNYKTSMIEKNDSANNAMIIDESRESLPELEVVPDINVSAESLNESGDVEADTNKEPFKFKQNDLFHFLNHPANLAGQIILGKYAIKREVNFARLKDNILMTWLTRRSNYKLTQSDFEDLKNQFSELFPTEDPDLLFVPYSSDGNGQCESARGSLYNHYKFVRKELREANIVSESNARPCVDIQQNPCIEENSLNCLVDSDNPEQYTAAQIITAWEASYEERVKSLVVKVQKRAKESLDKYLRSFSCLRPPLGVTLLQSDFKRIIGEKKANNEIPQDQCFTSLFSEKWPTVASKILLLHKKCKISEVQNFYKKHEKLIDQEQYHNVLALLLLPLCMTLPKTYKVGESKESTTASKAIIAKSFILHVEDAANLNAEKLAFEKWLRDTKNDNFPYVTISGSIDRITQTCVVLKSETYLQQNVVKAVELCFQCIIALRVFPYLCDYVWLFIAKDLYNLSTDCKFFAAVSKLSNSLKKI